MTALHGEMTGGCGGDGDGLSGTAPNGKRVCFGTDDPTNIWKKDGKYYMMAMGNKFLVRAYGVKRDKRTPRPNAPQEFLGDHLYLFESPDLHKWTYKDES